MCEHIRSPEFPWVCKERNRGSENVFKGLFRTSAFLGFFSKISLLRFQLFDLVLIGGDQRVAIGSQQSIHNLIDLGIDLSNFSGGFRLPVFKRSQTHVPKFCEHVLGNVKEARTRL
ncbi:MAG: hypothetical protein AAFY83_10455 [Pseudomonadota bacterium]